MVTDKRLSLKAKGLFAVMMSRPENWEFTVSGLAAFTGAGKDMIRSALAELEEVGYLIREQTHSEKGTFAGNVYVLQDTAPPLSENPTAVEDEKAPLSEKPSTGNPSTEKPLSENPTQSNKDLSNTRYNTPYPPRGGWGGPRRRT